MKKFSFSPIFLSLLMFGLELFGSGRPVEIPGSSLIRKYHGEKPETETPDNLICPYGSARTLVSTLCGTQLKTSQGQHLRVKLENTTITSYNVLRCIRQVSFVDPSQIKGIDPKNAYCITLNNLSLKHFEQITEILNTLKIAQNSVVVLDLRDNELESVQKEDLENFSNLQALFIDNNKVTTFSPKALSDTKIALLTMENNKLSAIKGLAKVLLEKYKTGPVFFNFSNNLVPNEEYRTIDKFCKVYSSTEEGFAMINFLSNSQTSCMRAIWPITSNGSDLLIKRVYLGTIGTDEELIDLIRNNRGFVKGCLGDGSVPIKNFKSLFDTLKPITVTRDLFWLILD